MSRSSRFYYRRTTEGVPFQWEMQPGTPKNTPPLTDVVPPPISPPPAMLSLSLSKPGRAVQNKQPLFVLFGPWWKQFKPKKNPCPLDHNNDKERLRFDSCGSHCEFMEESSCKAKSLQAAESSGHWRVGCGPWRINPIKIATGRRV
ncbi:uncharacterized protein LOC120070597 [Benincasa hispida]|uniref:uncharacterized protein LOC120070597 n=1 Tax=Benincasa hispida TaxID=102211 RepID=UPI001900DDB8|nr:uncharacterized protein LOC120070597 [Benincasa hispida]